MPKQERGFLIADTTAHHWVSLVSARNRAIVPARLNRRRNEFLRRQIKCPRRANMNFLISLGRFYAKHFAVIRIIFFIRIVQQAQSMTQLVDHQTFKMHRIALGLFKKISKIFFVHFDVGFSNTIIRPVQICHGLLAALQVLAEVVRLGKPVSEVCHLFEPLPQVLKNVKFKDGKPLDDATVKKAIADAEKRLGNSGRLVIRPSGTEPLIRVMAEGDDSAVVNGVVDELCGLIAKAAA